MKKIRLLVMAGVLLGLGTLSRAAVTHTIINKSDRPIYGWIAYRGEVKKLNSCRTDERMIQPGKSLTSKAGGCLLRFVQIEDGKPEGDKIVDKIIKLKVANASANIAKDTGIVIGYGALLLAAATSDHPIYYFPLASGGVPSTSTISELVVYAATSTVWEYDGTSLKPVEGVKGYGRHDFSRSN